MPTFTTSRVGSWAPVTDPYPFIEEVLAVIPVDIDQRIVYNNVSEIVEHEKP